MTKKTTSSTHLTPTLIHLNDQMQKTKRITTLSRPRNNNYSEDNLGKMRNKPSKRREGVRRRQKKGGKEKGKDQVRLWY